jgi:hypothetical protein
MRSLTLVLLFACNEPTTGHQSTALQPALKPETDQPAAIATEVAALADGSSVVSRPGAEPGETELWITPAVGEPRALAHATGADDLPTALPDGRVAFVSTRTTVASIWIVDPRSGAASQLTNRGLRAGKDLSGFVPTPMKRMTAHGSELRYESAPGVEWSVDVDTGIARRIEGAR